MPANSETPEEIKYVDRLDISVLSIAAIKDLIKGNIHNTIKCWENGMDIPKQTFRIVGPAGIGKTEICYQIAKELTEELKEVFDCMVVKCPVLSRDDFLIPFPVIDNGNTRFKMLYSDFIPTKQDSCGIYVIDEFSRGDHTLQQLMWQIQNEYKIHLRDLPKGWFVITIDNPDDQEYSIDNLEDAAGLRRMLHIYVEVNPKDFLDYAISTGYHKAVIEFIQAHPDYLYDFDAQKVGRVYANPASYERLSNILWGFECNGGINKNLSSIEALSSGLLNQGMTRRFINPKDILYDYNKVRSQIKKFKTENNNAKLGEIMLGFITYMTTSRPEFDDQNNDVNISKKGFENIVNFLTDIPIDTAALFIATIDNFSRRSPEFKYLTSIHVKLMQTSEVYKRLFYDELLACQQSAVANGNK